MYNDITKTDDHKICSIKKSPNRRNEPPTKQTLYYKYPDIIKDGNAIYAKKKSKLPCTYSLVADS